MDYSRLLELSDTDGCYSLTERDINVLLSFVTTQAMWATRWGNYEDFDEVEAYVSELAGKLMRQSGTCGGETVVSAEAVYRNIVIENGADDCECEDEMAQYPYYQKQGGVWYLGFPCADCGGVEWVPIGSGGELGTNGAGSGRNPAIPYLPSGTSVSGVGGASCFADRAVPYLAEQCAEMWEWLIDATITAIEYADLLTPVTEFFDGAALIADALSGSGTIRELTNLGVDVLKAIITAQGNVDALKARWAFTTMPTYGEIKAWIDGTTFPNEGAIAKKAWQTWALRLTVARHYPAFNAMLAECATGTDLSGISASSILYQNAQYIVYELSGYPLEIQAVPDIYVSQNVNTPDTAHAIILDVGTVSDENIDVRWLTSAGSTFRILATNGGGTIYTYGFNNTNWESVLTLIDGDIGITNPSRVFGNAGDNPLASLPAGSDISYRSFYFSSPTVQINRLLIIREL